MAIFRSLGGRPVTTRPPMRMSPSDGCSRPAIVRSNVVLPQPEGPSSTRYSPSAVARSMPSRAWTRPPSNCLRRFRTSTTTVISNPLCSRHPSEDQPAPGLLSADQLSGSPLGEDRVDLALGLGGRRGRRELAAGRPGEHVRDHEGAEDLAD